MRKRELIDLIAEAEGISRSRVKSVVEATFDSIGDMIDAGQNFKGGQLRMTTAKAHGQRIGIISLVDDGSDDEAATKAD